MKLDPQFNLQQIISKMTGPVVAEAAHGEEAGFESSLEQVLQRMVAAGNGGEPSPDFATSSESGKQLPLAQPQDEAAVVDPLLAPVLAPLLETISLPNGRPILTSRVEPGQVTLPGWFGSEASRPVPPALTSPQTAPMLEVTGSAKDEGHPGSGAALADSRFTAVAPAAGIARQSGIAPVPESTVSGIQALSPQAMALEPGVTSTAARLEGRSLNNIPHLLPASAVVALPEPAAQVRITTPAAAITSVAKPDAGPGQGGQMTAAQADPAAMAMNGEGDAAIPMTAIAPREALSRQPGPTGSTPGTGPIDALVKSGMGEQPVSNPLLQALKSRRDSAKAEVQAASARMNKSAQPVATFGPLLAAAGMATDARRSATVSARAAEPLSIAAQGSSVTPDHQPAASQFLVSVAPVSEPAIASPASGSQPAYRPVADSVLREAMSEQVIKIISTQFADGDHTQTTRLHIRLMPENLGSIDAEIIDAGGRTTVNLTAESEAVARVLRESAGLLRDQLGLGNTVDININWQGQQKSRDGRGFSAPQGERDAPLAADLEPLNNESSARASDTRGAIDTYV